MRELIRHIIREQTKWTPEMIHDIAKQYSKRGDFHKNHGAAYKWAKENGIFDEITSHMEDSKTGKSNSKNFIDKAKKIHGDKYDYSKTNYIGAKDLVTITCPEHGDFQLTPNKHLNGRGCQKCSKEKVKVERTKPQQEFIDQSEIKHDGKYGYSKVEYKSAKDKVIITCPIHGDFPQSPTHHLMGKGCPKCGDLIVPNRNTLEDFITNSNIIHNNKYDYSKADYKDSNSKVIITCPKHGDFEQTPAKHTNQKQGCPSCNESKGEKLINHLMINNGIKVVRQKRFTGCINTSSGKRCLPLPFDFYLPDYNTCIEYDGEQHYAPVLTFGGEEAFKRLQIRDEIKTLYCKKNGIKLIRIPYTMNKEDIEPYILSELGM